MNKARVRFAAGVVCCLICCLCICMPAEAVVFTDALDREVDVQNPQRVVALMGSFSEIWLLAGGEDSLVGTTVDVTDQRDLGIPAHVQSVGTYQEPNLEEIFALEPDLVLLSAETARTGSHIGMQSILEEAGIPAAYFKVTHFEDYLDMLQICTQLTGDMQAYERNGMAVQKKVEQILAENRLEKEPSVLLMITYSGGVRPQSADTMTGRMLAQLGCRNILDEYPSLLKDFSMERVIEMDPDYIFVIPMGNDDAAVRRNLQESVESNPAWNALSAVENGRYILLPGDMFVYKPNAQWAKSYAYLAEILSGTQTE